MNRRWTVCASLVFAPLVLGGCLGFLPRTEPSRFYVLDIVPGAPAGAPLQTALGVGPVELPAYLDRPQIATRTGANEIRYEDLHRWANPLSEAVQGILLVDIATRLGTENVSGFPFALGLPRDYDVTVAFVRFEPTESGEVVLDAIWRIRDTANGNVLAVRRTQLSGSVVAGDYAAMASALSQGLAELSDRIAAELREVVARYPEPEPPGS
jgi:uncharacterized lipoprotein YmbA